MPQTRGNPWIRLVDRVLDEVGTDAPQTAREGVIRWVEAVDGWRDKVDLTAARSAEELVDLMVADAAVLASQLPEGASVVDVGSGAGAPGLPLALLRSDLKVALVEPKHKRAALLRSVLGQLAMAGSRRLLAEVVQARAEALGSRTFDVALSRATLAPSDWLALGARLAPAGEVWVLLARQPEPALPGWEIDARRAYRWPLTGVERRAVGYRPR